MSKELYAKAKESVKSAKVILDDMRVNRSQYGATDLAWRCLDIDLVLVEVMDMVLEVIKPKKKKVDNKSNIQRLTSEIIEEEKEEEKSEEEKLELEEEKNLGKESGIPKLKKTNVKKKNKKKPSVKPSRPKVVKGNKKKG